jgi:hypothetical protein
LGKDVKNWRGGDWGVGKEGGSLDVMGGYGEEELKGGCADGMRVWDAGGRIFGGGGKSGLSERER